MHFSASIQLLTCLMLCASSAHGIMVKYGTKDGPIEPPTPEPTLPPSQPFRVPAPVWEERSNDTPDPNAQWRPRVFNIQPRYTHVVYKASQTPLTSAQRFVNAYVPNVQPIKAQPVKNYFTPAQILGSQNTPGVGLRYFAPVYESEQKVPTKQEDANQNSIDANEVDIDRHDSGNDLQWKFEKEITKRLVRNTQDEGVIPVIQWTSYILPRHR